MPVYTFRVRATGEEFTHIMSMAAREIFLANTEVEQIIVSAPMQVDSHKLDASRGKPTGDFQNRLKEIKKFHGHHSTIRTHGVSEV